MRTCGECTACCRTMAVLSIQKPALVACSKLCAAGCSIYESRPEDCRTFSCAWLLDQGGDVFGDDLRPDKLGAVPEVKLVPQPDGREDWIMYLWRNGPGPENARLEKLMRRFKRNQNTFVVMPAMPLNAEAVPHIRVYNKGKLDLWADIQFRPDPPPEGEAT